MPKCDLQVHSRYSNRPSEWVLRQLGVPESYTQPEVFYRELRKKGFDFVTLTDHNTIEGCLRIAGMPGAFISEEITTYFPEDRCKIHLLAWNITEQQHRDIRKVRENIFELADYLNEQNIVHGVAHPLLSINGRLTVEHFEKLVLLFRVFEGRNGTRAPLAQDIATLCLSQLTPEWIDALADKHNIQPRGEEPWEKSLTGGSDDHGGLYFGETWTEVPSARSVEEFLQQVNEGNCRPAGAAGDPMRLTNSIYNVVFSYAADRLPKNMPRTAQFLGKMTQRFLDGKNPTHFSLSERIGHLVEAVRTGKALDFLKPPEAGPSLNREIASYFLNPRVKASLDRIIAEEPLPARRSFKMASKIANDLSYRLFQRFLACVNQGELVDSLQPLSGLIPIAMGVTPYVFAFHSLHGNRRFLETTAVRFLRERPPELRNTKRAWFTDTLEDINGVARTIRTMCLSAKKAGKDLVVVTSRSEITIRDIAIQNFAPVGEFELPEYKLQKLSFPPLLDMIDYIEREKFTECIISTPGPIGVTALAAAKLLGLKTSGIYHTDFPQYVRILTEDDVMETLMWKYMHWFYSQLDLVYVNSDFYRRCWVERGIAPEKLEILPRGLDTELFNPKHRDSAYWKRRGAKGPVILYVGRVSKEKDLAFLAKVYHAVKQDVPNATLAIVGEGPFRRELSKIVPDGIFTGILTGQELGIAYASADLFAFPSTTDTFGNVVLEAVAAGLPVLVSDIGGPKELVQDLQHCSVLPANHLTSWVDACRSSLHSPPATQALRANVQRLQAERSWDAAFDQFWARSLD